MNLSSLRAFAAYIVLGVVCVVAGLSMRAWDTPEWMSPDTTQHPAAMRPWMVEADCYSQMARVQRILNGQGLVQNHFTVENWPEGMDPSTTSPFDYAILLLYFPLWLFTKHPLDWAGALVSPALWIALVLFWSLIRSREFNVWGRSLLLIGSAALPAFLWATAFGRPRHQSLILALMAMGLTAEYERWQIELTPKRAWNIFAGVVWGLACWTSLFEPAVVLTVLVVFNLVARRKENGIFLFSFGVVALLMVLVEGGHIFRNIFNIYNLTPEYRTYAVRWLSTIAEVQPIDTSSVGNFLGALIERFTLGIFVLPLAMWWLWPRGGYGNKVDALVIILTGLLTILTMVQSRWYYYASLGQLILVARFCQVTPAYLPGVSVWVRALTLLVFATSMIYEDDQQLEGHAEGPSNQPSLQLAQISRAIDQPGGIMAPWWISPGLLYFSGHPIVSGSSHCGITGIVASAKFFSATSWRDAEDILRARQVRWIVVWDDPRYVYPLLNTSRGILGLPSATDEDPGDAGTTVAQFLITDRYLPTAIQLRAVSENLKLYEFVPDAK